MGPHKSNRGRAASASRARLSKYHSYLEQKAREKTEQPIEQSEIKTDFKTAEEILDAKFSETEYDVDKIQRGFVLLAMEEYRQQPGESKSDPIRRFFERANMVLLGDYSNHISESQWKIIQTAMTDIEKRTGLMTIATEFYVDGNLDDEKMAQPKEDERNRKEICRKAENAC